MPVTPLILEDEDSQHNRITVTGQFNPAGRLLVEVQGMRATGQVAFDREQIMTLIEFLTDAINLDDLPYED